MWRRYGRAAVAFSQAGLQGPVPVPARLESQGRLPAIAVGCGSYHPRGGRGRGVRSVQHADAVSQVPSRSDRTSAGPAVNGTGQSRIKPDSVAAAAQPGRPRTTMVCRTAERVLCYGFQIAVWAEYPVGRRRSISIRTGRASTNFMAAECSTPGARSGTRSSIRSSGISPYP